MSAPLSTNCFTIFSRPVTTKVIDFIKISKQFHKSKPKLFKQQLHEIENLGREIYSYGYLFQLRNVKPSLHFCPQNLCWNHEQVLERYSHFLDRSTNKFKANGELCVFDATYQM